ncbi:SoxR reducing system RseC family protein [Thalassotalea sp. 1_MG-2023]|uniref:SoxR reducing system RseC family protein n=1 Tax=Thalassotalea sp. 1_MG-2023 TaxID=3062680 RepID=UPI0026E28A89|nr:SoxR reducing system RseC family protein [Thalassotalea sp. 1_MG-2023]MDO6427419.1 SoxR reducing system RseC family protein [Thalassotalea sp. 1_MG-2023]
MIEEHAQVIEINGEQAVVQTTVKSTCSGCQQLESCGSGQVAKAFGQKQVSYQINATTPVNIGDNVLIGLSEQVLLSAAWQVYLWPLIGLFVGSITGQYFFALMNFTHELFALFTGILGGYLGFKCAQFKQQRAASDERWHAKLLKVIQHNESSSQRINLS